MRKVCADAKHFRVPKLLASGGYRLRTTARFNERHAPVDVCFHDFELAQKFIADFVANPPPVVPKAGVE